MARITIAGDAIVITSTKTLEDIKKLEKSNPKALTLFETNEDGKKEEVFTVGSTNGNGSINGFSAAFGSVTHDERKLATITMLIPSGVEDAMEYAYEKIGGSLSKLKKVEEQMGPAIANAAREKAAFMAELGVAAPTAAQE